MEKVKVTQEQARAIEYIKKNYRLEFNIEKHTRGWTNIKTESLNDLSLDGIIRSLYIGYEVEPEFKIGDWITCETVNKTSLITDAQHHIGAFRIFVDDEDFATYSEYRHATPEEIAEEKQRRFWKDNDRDEYELKKNDLLNINDDFLSIREFYGDEVIFENNCTEDREHLMFLFKNGNAEVVCFAEDRKDI